jgi:molybdopterin-guanine dinucleotide biosynthesis protein A
MMINRIDVVVLAGGGALKADPHPGGKKTSPQATPGGGHAASKGGRPVPDPDISLCGSDMVRNKALLTIGGRPMVDYVIEALRQCPSVDRIVLVGDASFRSSVAGRRTSCLHPGLNAGPEQRMEAASKNLENEQKAGGLLFASSGDSPLGSLASGVAALPDTPYAADWVLACTGDIPFLTAGAVSEFLQQCSGREADFYYPVITRQVAENRFPGVRRTYARLRDGVFTGGNLFLLRRSIIGDVLPKAGDFIRLRKKPLALARLVGLDFLAAYLFGWLTIAMAERRVSRLVGYRGAAVISGCPEIGVDVDKISDLEMARRLLAP